jgi:hypothetical protein
MRKWISFTVRPDGRSEAAWTDELQTQHAEVAAWLRANAHKSTRLKLISGRRSHTIDELSRPTTFAHLQVKFRGERDAVLFKMYFGDVIFTPFAYNSVILPIFRRVMPSIIANEILGVSPMCAPVGSIFALKAKYREKQRKQNLRLR